MPRNFPSRTRQQYVDVAGIFLLVGRRTIRVLASGASFAEFWAYLRYIFAWQSDRWLTLTPEFSELDTHQKTILSDDIGMGLPLHWLSRRLNLIGICDGRYVLDRYLATYGFTYAGSRAARHGRDSRLLPRLPARPTWKGLQLHPGRRSTFRTTSFLILSVDHMLRVPDITDD